MRTELPDTLEDLLHLPGLGPKRVRSLYYGPGIQRLRQLERAARKGELRALPGLGAKTEQRILDNIDALRSGSGRYLRSTAIRLANPLIDYLKSIKGVKDVVLAGSFRRGCETVGDLDILVSANSADSVMRKFVKYTKIRKILSKGPTRATVVVSSNSTVNLKDWICMTITVDWRVMKVCSYASIAMHIAKTTWTTGTLELPRHSAPGWNKKIS